MTDDLPSSASSENITSRSKKNEIFKAYQELLASVEAGKPGEDATPPVPKTTPNSQGTDTIIQSLSSLRTKVNSAISELADQLTAEAGKIARFQKTITAEKQVLEEDMQKKRQEWEEEQQRLKKERAQEEEEYRYQLEKERKRENDIYQEKKEQKERDFKEREARLKAAEDELEHLRKEVESFPNRLEKTVEAAREETKDELENKAKIKHEFYSKDVESEKKLMGQQINTLQKTVQAQAAEISALKKELERTTDRFKDLAGKVIEGTRPQEAPEPPKD